MRSERNWSRASRQHTTSSCANGTLLGPVRPRFPRRQHTPKRSSNCTAQLGELSNKTESNFAMRSPAKSRNIPRLRSSRSRKRIRGRTDEGKTNSHKEAQNTQDDGLANFVPLCGCSFFPHQFDPVFAFWSDWNGGVGCFVISPVSASRSSIPFCLRVPPVERCNSTSALAYVADAEIWACRAP